MRFRDVKALWDCALFSKGIMYFHGFLRVIIWGLKGKYLAYHRSQWYQSGKEKKSHCLHEKDEWFYFIRSDNCQLSILFSVDRHKTRESDFVDRKKYINTKSYEWLKNLTRELIAIFYLYLYFNIDVNNNCCTFLFATGRSHITHMKFKDFCSSFLITKAHITL